MFFFNGVNISATIFVSGGATVGRTRAEPDQKRFAPDKNFFLRIETEMIIL